MSESILSNLEVTIDSDITFQIIPQSLSFGMGFPENVAKATDGGTVCFGQDWSKAIGSVKFDIYTTKENVKKLKILNIRAKAGILVQVGFKDAFTGENFTMQKAVCKNSNELSTGADGKVTVEFIGENIA